MVPQLICKLITVFTEDFFAECLAGRANVAAREVGDSRGQQTRRRAKRGWPLVRSVGLERVEGTCIRLQCALGAGAAARPPRRSPVRLPGLRLTESYAVCGKAYPIVWFLLFRTPRRLDRRLRPLPALQLISSSEGQDWIAQPQIAAYRVADSAPLW